MATETGEGAAETGDSVAESEETGEESDIEEGYSQYARSVIVTTGATLSGMGAGILSDIYVSDPQGNTGILIVLAAILVQFPIYSSIGMNVRDWSTKGKIYIGFMTFVLWFITWSVILTTGAL